MWVGRESRCGPWHSSLPLSQPLSPMLSLVISLKLVPCPPFPFNFSLPLSPLLPSQHPHNPSVSCPISFVWARQRMLWGVLMMMMMMCSWCTVFETIMNLNGHGMWTSSSTVLSHMVYFLTTFINVGDLHFLPVQLVLIHLNGNLEKQFKKIIPVICGYGSYWSLVIALNILKIEDKHKKSWFLRLIAWFPLNCLM